MSTYEECTHGQRKVHLVRRRERRRLLEMTVSLMRRGLEMKAPSCSVRLKDEGRRCTPGEEGDFGHCRYHILTDCRPGKLYCRVFDNIAQV